MEVAKRDEIFGVLREMSDRQVDPAVKKRLLTLIGRPNEDIKDELLGLIDDIAYFSWTSDFEIGVMHTIWCNIGGSELELQERNRNLQDTPENKAKYKWER